MTRVARLRVDKASTRRRNRFWLGVFGLFSTTLIAVLAAWAVVPALIGWIPFAVTSDSMGPIIERGDVIVAQPHDGANLAENTILLYESPKGRTAHRINEVLSPIEYRTKGDANRDPDSATVHADQVVGVARIVVPGIGRLILFAREDPFLKGFPMALIMIAIAWTSRFALMARFDPWLRVTEDELDPAPVVDRELIDVDRIIQRRQAERLTFRDTRQATESVAIRDGTTRRGRTLATAPRGRRPDRDLKR